MSEEVIMILGEGNKGINKPSSVYPYESAWLGRWTQLGNEVKFHDQSNDESKCSMELVRPEDSIVKENHGVGVMPFPIFKVSHKRDSTSKPYFHQDVGSSSNATVNRMPWMYPQGEKFSSSNCLDFPIQEKTTQNLLELIRPVRIYTTVDSVNLSGSISLSSTKGKGRKYESAIHPRTEIPDMNEEPPLVPDRENSVDGHWGETSYSATQSMNVGRFLSRECKRVRLEQEAEPNSRWVKRLKTNTSDSIGHDETKSLMRIEEASSGQKGNNNNKKNLFLEILKSGINNLQPRTQEPVSSQIKNVNRGGAGITLLHPWIQRWCKKKATSTDQPGGQEDSFEKEMEKKHFPSIAAMALMGKALSGLNQYALRKTDSLMVWNARDLR